MRLNTTAMHECRGQSSQIRKFRSKSTKHFPSSANLPRYTTITSRGGASAYSDSFQPMFIKQRTGLTGGLWRCRPGRRLQLKQQFIIFIVLVQLFKLILFGQFVGERRTRPGYPQQHLGRAQRKLSQRLGRTGQRDLAADRRPRRRARRKQHRPHAQRLRRPRCSTADQPAI